MNIEVKEKILYFRDYEYEIMDIEDIDGYYYSMITNKNVFCFDIDVTINDIKFNSVSEVKNYILNG